MLIHKKIRTETIATLKPHLLEKMKRFYSGRLLRLNASEQCPAIAVYLENIESEEITTCESSFDAMLNIGIYFPPNAGEDELDSVAEIVRNVMTSTEFDSLDSVSLKGYRYEYDEEQATWVSSTLLFAVSYND